MMLQADPSLQTSALLEPPAVTISPAAGLSASFTTRVLPKNSDAEGRSATATAPGDPPGFTLVPTNN